MRPTLPRREFLGVTAGLGLGLGLAPLRALTPASAAEMVVAPEAVRFRPEIEPVVRWIEDTPRERIFDVALEHLKGGLPYRDLMAGLFLAGIRNVKPRPVGFKFHAVMVINSAHVLGQAAPDSDRLLPMFWALDNFKNAQAQDVREGDWTLGRVDEARLPSAARAREQLVAALDAWDEEAADAATAALCRSDGAAGVMEVFWHYGLRDQRNIGHKPIFTMQCWRTLQAIGWQNAEPVLRSLAYGLLDRQGDSARSAVGPYEANLERARRLGPEWTRGRTDPGATREMLATLRTADSEGASQAAFEKLQAGVAPESLWDAVTLAANEMLLQAPGIVPLHAATAANALHYTYQASGDSATRAMALLQAAGWIPLYRSRTDSSSPLHLDELEPADLDAQGPEAVGEIFTTASSNRRTAAAKALAFLRAGGPSDALFDTARRMIFQKGTDSHQYKYGAAVWEEFLLASDDALRAPIAAAALAYVPTSESPDSNLMRRARAAVDRVLGRSAEA